MTTLESHQLKIAKSTLKMSCAGSQIMGGPDHLEAMGIIARLTGKRIARPADCACRNAVKVIPSGGYAFPGGYDWECPEGHRSRSWEPECYSCRVDAEQADWNR